MRELRFIIEDFMYDPDERVTLEELRYLRDLFDKEIQHRLSEISCKEIPK